jgi:hypothetical protein
MLSTERGRKGKSTQIESGMKELERALSQSRIARIKKEDKSSKKLTSKNRR